MSNEENEESTLLKEGRDHNHIQWSSMKMNWIMYGLTNVYGQDSPMGTVLRESRSGIECIIIMNSQ